MRSGLVQWQPREGLGFFSCPKALQISSDSTLLWLRPSAKATTERI